MDVLYTFNGERFDLPFIEHHLGPNLARRLEHRNLMYCCWDWGPRGGQKAVERKLGIGRKAVGLDGADAVDLWLDYEENGSKRARRTLLRYNVEDIANLAHIRRKLGVQRQSACLVLFPCQPARHQPPLDSLSPPFAAV